MPVLVPASTYSYTCPFVPAEKVVHVRLSIHCLHHLCVVNLFSFVSALKSNSDLKNVIIANRRSHSRLRNSDTDHDQSSCAQSQLAISFSDHVCSLSTKLLHSAWTVTWLWLWQTSLCLAAADDWIATLTYTQEMVELGETGPIHS